MHFAFTDQQLEYRYAVVQLELPGQRDRLHLPVPVVLRQQ